MLVKDKDDHKKHKDHKKVFDVVRPGGVPALPTSRPVIMGHKAPVQDDQFMPGAPTLRAGDPEAKHDLLDPKSKKALNPVSAEGASAQINTNTAPGRAASESESQPPAHIASEIETPPEVASVEASGEASTTQADNPEKTSLGSETAPATTEMGSASVSSGAQDAQEQAVDSSTSVAQQPAAIANPAPASAASRTSAGAFVDAHGTFHEEESTPAHVAMGQTVQADIDGDSGRSATQTSSDAQPARLKTIDDLLAETGAPELGPDTSPGLIISHHHNKGHALRSSILLFLSIIIVAALVLNFLLDADILTATGVWHTDLIN